MPFRSHLLYLAVCLFAFAAVLTPISSAQQQPQVPAPHKHAFPVLPFTGNWHRPAVQRSMVGGMWMIDANFKSSIYIRNSVKVAPITVTPILWLSNGQKFQLADVALEPAGIAVVNINQALADKGIASWATLRGYVEIQYNWPWDALCVTIRNVDVLHSVILSHNLRPVAQPNLNGETVAAGQLRTYEGLWWKQESDVTGFVSISNSSTNPMSAQIQVTDNQANPLGSHTVTVSPHGTKVVDLTELRGTTANAGGVQVTYEGPNDALLFTGGLEDPATGYSANFQLRHGPKPSDKPASLTYTALGLMTGEADPMMRFPAGTRFAPYFVARNLSSQAYKIQPRLYWMENSVSRTLPLPQVSISPYATVNLNLPSLISATSLANFNGNVNLAFDFQGQPGALQMASGSVDQRNTYVFQVSTQAIGESAGKGLSYWSTANGDDTMITLWNPADEEQDFVFTLFFSGGHYKYPMRLGPKVTRTLNISEIIQTQIPDDEGNLVPPSVQQGSAEIAGPEGETQPILIAVDAGVYNVQKATCAPICIDCAGVESGFITVDPFAVSVGKTKQQTFTLQFKSGTQSNATGSATWGSSNNSVGTVKAGLVTGVAGGSLNLSASLYTVTEFGEVCQPEQDGIPSCGEGLVSAPPAPGNVISITSVSPSPLIYGGSGALTITGSGFSALTGTLSINFDDNAITASGSVVSNSQITGTYQVTCGATVGAHTVSVSAPGGDGGSGGGSDPFGITVSLPSAPAATLKFGGNSISGTQSVVVGQQIVLAASLTVPNCTSVASQSWQVPGTTVGSFTVAGTTGSTSQSNFLTSPTTFYWVDAADQRQVSYSYTLNTGTTSPPVTATFNVLGPTSSVKTSLGTVQIINNGTMGFNPPSDIGITFTATVTPPAGYGGTVEWVQLISNFTIVFTSPKVTLTCTPPAYGLDFVYPYSTGSSTNDSPNNGLADPDGNPNTETTTSFSAQMFLMWTPSSVSQPIPVPLGSVNWGWSGDATLNTSTNVWSLKSSSRNANAFVSGPSYPTWQDIVLQNEVVCN